MSRETVRHHFGTAMIILAGVIISAMGFAVALHWDVQIARTEFEHEANNHFESIRREIEFSLQKLTSVKAFFDSTDYVGRAAFTDLTKPLLSLQSSVQAIGWAPGVLRFERSEREENARRDGIADFQITEREFAGGKMIRAADREQYFPVYFIEPYLGNEAVLGFDMLSDPKRREALERAQETGEITGTARIELPEKSSNRFGFLVFAPVYKRGLDSTTNRGENIRGFAVAIFRIGDIIEKSLTYLKPGGIDIYLYDRSTPQEESFLYYHPSRTRKTTGEPGSDDAFESARKLSFANREWLIIQKAAPGFAATGKTWRPWGVLAMGLLLTATLASYFFMQRRTKNNIEEQLRFLQTLIDTIPSPIFYKDVEGRYLGCNSAFEASIGLSKSKIVGGTVYDVAPRDLADIYRKADLALFQSRGVQSYEAAVRYADGALHDVLVAKATFSDAAGKVAGMVGVMIDITERKRAEDERARLATAIEQVNEGIIITDPDWNILYANPAFERITGYVGSEIIGKHTRILKSDINEEKLYTQLRETLLRGEGWFGRLINKRKDGTFYDAEVTASAIRDESGAIVNYVSIHRDVTREAQLERELRQAQKMKAIGNLAGGIAHDFNNILAAIMGFTELSLNKVPGDSQVRRNLDQVMKAASRASDLVQQILTFSRKTEQERKPVNIGPIVEEALRLLRSSLPSTIEIRQEIAIDPDEGVVLADATQIHQVLMNLCTNSAHAMRARGGILSVKLSAVTDTSMFPGRLDLKGGRYVRLAVSDTGHGMDAVVMERIFDPYYTTKEQGEGTGLGLSVVQGIVRSHGGSITVHSEPGVGTTFYVFLPMLDEVVAPEVKSAEPLPTGRERILLVDDETALVDLGKGILESLGYTVTAKTSSLEALEAFRAAPHAFDLVITDMTMPELTGRELAENLHAIRGDIPIILCTGYSDRINEKQAKDLGISGFVMKPYVIATLATAIQRVLESSRHP